MPWNLGFSELLIILFIVLLVFGAKRLPEMGRSLGGGIREFKKSLTSINDEEDEKTTSSSKPIEEAKKES